MEDVLAILRGLEGRDEERYVALSANVHRLTGMVLAARGDVYDAFRRYALAIQGFDRLHEGESAAAVRALAATMLHMMGNPAEAWPLRRAALRIAGHSGDPRLLELVLSEAAFNELFERRHDTALALYRVAEALPSLDASRRFEIILWSSLYWNASLPNLTRAETALKAIREPARRANGENALRFARGIAATLGTHPERAEAILTQCIGYSRTTKHTLMLPYIFLHRAVARRTQG